MTEPDLRVLIERLMERLAAHSDKIAALERMETRYVPREIYEQQLRRIDADQLDLAGDQAKTSAVLYEFMQRNDQRWEEFRRERERREREVEVERANDARARKALTVTVIGIVVTLALGLMSVVIGVLAL